MSSSGRISAIAMKCTSRNASTSSSATDAPARVAGQQRPVVLDPDRERAAPAGQRDGASRSGRCSRRSSSRHHSASEHHDASPTARRRRKRPDAAQREEQRARRPHRQSEVGEVEQRLRRVHLPARRRCAARPAPGSARRLPDRTAAPTRTRRLPRPRSATRSRGSSIVSMPLSDGQDGEQHPLARHRGAQITRDAARAPPPRRDRLTAATNSRAASRQFAAGSRVRCPSLTGV